MRRCDAEEAKQRVVMDYTTPAGVEQVELELTGDPQHASMMRGMMIAARKHAEIGAEQ